MHQYMYKSPYPSHLTTPLAPRESARISTTPDRTITRLVVASRLTPHAVRAATRACDSVHDTRVTIVSVRRKRGGPSVTNVPPPAHDTDSAIDSSLERSRTPKLVDPTHPHDPCGDPAASHPRPTHSACPANPADPAQTGRLTGQWPRGAEVDIGIVEVPDDVHVTAARVLRGNSAPPYESRWMT